MKNKAEELYQKYLQLCKLKEEQMNPIQRREMRKAFMAGFIDAMDYLFHLAEKYPEEEAAALGFEARKGVMEFWERTVDEYNGGTQFNKKVDA